jgi:exopolysaccharide biosynthesis polyprenyl glycosylphosphotransferase
MKHLDFIILELICFQAAFCLACILRHGLVNPYSSVLYRNTALVSALIQIFCIISFQVFHNVLRRGYYRELLSMVKTDLCVMLLLVFYLFVVQQGAIFSRIVLVTSGVYYFLIGYLVRSLWKAWLRIKTQGNIGKRSLVIISEDSGCVRDLILRLMERNYGEYTISGVILVDKEQVEPGEQIEGIPIVAGRDDAAEYLCRDWVDEVLLDLSRRDEYRQELINVMMDMNMVVHLRLDLENLFSEQKAYLQKLGNDTVVTMSVRMMRTRDAVFKRMLDILGGLVGTVITGILFVILGPIIYHYSPGSVIFSQMRVGRNGKLFKIYKFRSMYLDAEERKQELASQNEVESGMMFKMENDPRIIGSEKGPGKGIGNFIRKYSLDEFPQFFNVLKGDMSLVGTRPPTVDEWEKYNFHHRGRLSIKPGLTGLWQVSGRSDIQDFEEVVAMDTQYIADWSIGLDIKILLKTVLAVTRAEGAK